METGLSPSPFLHFPNSQTAGSNHGPVLKDLREFVLQKNYPCVAAIKSVSQSEYMVGFYQNFGMARFWREIRQDLQYFLQEQARTGSIYLTYWAIFMDEEPLTEDDFERKLWRELSHLTSLEKRTQDWGSSNISDPAEPSFSLSIDGKAFFVVGLHPQNSRLARKFSRPALVFNAMEQFEKLENAGQYETMKNSIRKRDTDLQDSINPMVAEYGDKWEAIQFSGKQNPPTWKCPFQFLSDEDKI